MYIRPSVSERTYEQQLSNAKKLYIGPVLFALLFTEFYNLVRLNSIN